MIDERANRKMSAILSADVKGYSRLMSTDEEGTVKDLNACREIIAKCVQDHRGRVVDSSGDNVLAEFVSTVEAVKCAVQIQKDLKVRNADLPEDRWMEFRIGVNLGDVIEEEGRIYGDGVNISARLEALTDAGGVSISGTAFDQVKGKLSLGYQFIGEQTVKNIPDPIRVYKVLMDERDAGKLIGVGKKAPKTRWAEIAAIVVFVAIGLVIYQFYVRSPAIEPASVEKMAFPLPDKPSIAVLPFDNMTGDPKQDYFSDGITEEIISNLSKIAELFVIARNSTAVYKGKPVKVQQVAEELGVHYVLEGSVQKAGDRVRITVQLIDALKGNHVWSESYDRELEDIFALQDDISMEVVTAMRVKLSEGEQARLMRKGTKNLKAYLKLLEGAEQSNLLNKEANLRTRQLYEEAIALEPEYAAAYGLLGLSHFVDVLFGWSNSPAESFQKAYEFSQKTLSLDDSLPMPYRTIGNIYLLQKKYEKAIAHAQQAVELSPNAAVFLFNMGWTLRCAGRPEEGIPFLEKAVRLDPIPHDYQLDSLGRAYFLTGRYEEAIAAYRKAVAANPDWRDAHVGLASTYAILGHWDEARAEVSEILRIEPNFTIGKYEKLMSHQTGLEAEIEGLRKAGLPE